jgi:hypothetical protein
VEAPLVLPIPLPVMSKFDFAGPSFRRLCPSRNAAAALELARDVPCVSAGSVRAAAAMASLSLASCATTVPGAMAQVCG